jgi:uncharacterized protein (DUF4415 family)
MSKIEAEPYRGLDFENAKRGSVLPVEPGKTKLSIRLDNAILHHFRRQVETAGSGNYQILTNE